jgi:uncharacterized protein YkwD
MPHACKGRLPMTRPACLLMLCLCLLPNLAQAECQIPKQTAAFEAQVIDLINQERAAKGLGAVALSVQLQGIAQAHACDIAAREVVTHEGKDGSHLADRLSQNNYRPRKAVENAAAGYDDASGVMHGWMESKGHRKNILVNLVTEAGLGVASGPNDKRLYWILVMGVQR